MDVDVDVADQVCAGPWESPEEWVLPDGYTAKSTGIWTSVTGPDQCAGRVPQGWKLHVSARPGSLAATVDGVLPTLLGAGCDFKIIGSAGLLQELNAGLHGAGAVGKAITVYPAEDRVVELGHRLADSLRGFEGPRLNSDRRIRADAPVYYRFGPISPRVCMNDAGDIDVMVEAPDGRRTSGLAGATYWSPDWTADPFGREEPCGTPAARIDGELVVGDHYRVLGGITRTHRGSLFRAIDLTTGGHVVIKQAKAFVDETSEGDARAYLRNERRVLGALDGIPGVPRVVDHFAYGDDEYLVTTDLGSSNLRTSVLDHGVFDCEPGAPRNVFDLARRLVRAVDAVHGRGVVIRDLAPKNVVALPDGGWGLVDFELSRYEGYQRFGWTPGYCHPRQRSHAAGAVEDDFYSLGATLFYATTGFDPIIVDEDPDTNVARTVSCLTAVCGADAPVTALITGLLDSDAAARASAAQQLRKTVTAAPEGARPDLNAPPCPPVGPVLWHTLDTVLRQAGEISVVGPRESRLPPPATPYAGTAGVVMELSHHTRALPTAMELAAITAQVVDAVEAPPGLIFGRMGIALALRAVARATDDDQLRRAADTVVPSGGEVTSEQRVDISHGLAGLGVGYLSLAATAPDPRPYDELADQCAARLLGDVDIDEKLAALPEGDPAHGISVADGFAHGRAGIAYFLMAHAARTGHEESHRRARQLADALADLVPDLSVRAASPQGRPMSGSWCQGLAGIGTTLVRAARFFDDGRLLAAARTAATGCRAIAPRVPLVTQCCGLAGIGELLVDLAVVTGDDRHRREAGDVLGLMATRSGGAPTSPRFPDNTLGGESPGWATGSTGVLSFVRRLADPASPRLWMADSPALFPVRGEGR